MTNGTGWARMMALTSAASEVEAKAAELAYNRHNRGFSTLAMILEINLRVCFHESMTTEGVFSINHSQRQAYSVVRALFWVVITSIVACLILPVLFKGISPVPILIGLMALAIAIAIPTFLGRRRLIFMGVWLAIYLLVYGVLSWRGGYIDGNFGGSDNRSIWYPAYCGGAYRSPVGRQKCSLRPLGWFFLPLVILDRTIIHRTHFDAY